MKRYTIVSGNNTLHNVRLHTVICESDTQVEKIIDAFKESHPQTEFIIISTEYIMNVGIEISKKFVGTYPGALLS